jgi:hypothetical protein
MIRLSRLSRRHSTVVRATGSPTGSAKSTQTGSNQSRIEQEWTQLIEQIKLEQRSQCTITKKTGEQFLTNSLRNPNLIGGQNINYDVYRRSLIYGDQIPLSFIFSEFTKMKPKQQIIHHNKKINRLIPEIEMELYLDIIKKAAKLEKATELEAELIIEELLINKQFKKMEILLDSQKDNLPKSIFTRFASRLVTSILNDDNFSSGTKIKEKYNLPDEKTAPAVASYFAKNGKFGNVHLLESQLEGKLRPEFYLSLFGQTVEVGNEFECSRILNKISSSYVSSSNLGSLFRIAQNTSHDTFELRQKIIEIASQKGMCRNLFSNSPTMILEMGFESTKRSKNWSDLDLFYNWAFNQIKNENQPMTHSKNHSILSQVQVYKFTYTDAMCKLEIAL